MPVKIVRESAVERTEVEDLLVKAWAERKGWDLESYLRGLGKISANSAVSKEIQFLRELVKYM